YSESFEPLMGVDGNGNLYEPLTGSQWEVGIKYAPDWLDGYVTASAFRIEQDNNLIPGPGSAIQAGMRETRGFELEGVGYITPRLHVIATYTYTDTEVDLSTSNRDV